MELFFTTKSILSGPLTKGSHLDQPHKYKILVVDDEVELTDIIGSYLKMSGYDYQLANSADVAMSCILHDRFDLVICDLVMPGMSGLEFYQEVRKKGMKLPFIFCSGLDESACLESIPEGILDFVQKPFAMSDLMNSISKFLVESSDFKKN